MPAMLVLLFGGLGSVVPTPHAAASARQHRAPAGRDHQDRLKRIQYRPALIDGFLVQTGLSRCGWPGRGKVRRAGRAGRDLLSRIVRYL